MTKVSTRGRRALAAWSVLFCAAALPRAATAAKEAEPIVEASAATSAASGTLLPLTLSPRVDAERASVAVTSGYDGAQSSATLTASADMRVFGPVAARVGFTYVPQADQEATFKPHVGLRLQALSQARHGVDGGLGVFYRMERFTEDEGLVQVVGSLGRRFGAVGIFTNVSYGQDPEGDDRDGDVKLAALYAVGEQVQVGVDGRYRFDLFSDDARRAERRTTKREFAVGPLVTLTTGAYALVAQLGVNGAEIERFETGLLATLGVASVF